MALFRDDRETICALSTPPGVGGIAVVRLSGDGALQICRKLAPFLPNHAESHRVYYGLLLSADGAEEIDEVLLTYFGEGRSFTGEATCEISVHGSPVIVSRVLKELILAGARPADPGEFTYRAFLNGRIDLAQAEAVLQLIESQSESARRVALRQLKGNLSKSVAQVEDQLVGVLAELEANLDFSQEDIVFAPITRLRESLLEAQARIGSLLSSFRAGRIAKNGFTVAILGLPNVGKSSLLNAISGLERAIVSDQPGTTRDPVEIEVPVGSHLVRFVDTAGIRESTDTIEQMGIDRTWSVSKQADMIFWVDDFGHPLPPPELNSGARVVRVRNKVDLLGEGTTWDVDLVPISAKNGFGVDRLFQVVTEELAKIGQEQDVTLLIGRHFDLLKKAQGCVLKGLQILSEGASPEFVIFEIHEALSLVMEVQGKRVDDEVMDQVFRQFCLGK